MKIRKFKDAIMLLAYFLQQKKAVTRSRSTKGYKISRLSHFYGICSQMAVRFLAPRVGISLYPGRF
jgi:hypothetical protein